MKAPNCRWWLALCAGLLVMATLFAQVPVRIERAGGTNVLLTWTNSPIPFRLEQADVGNFPSGWTTVLPEPTLTGNDFSLALAATNDARFFRLRERPLVRIASTSPFNGESGVGPTRETIIYFSGKLATNTFLDTAHLHADFGGRRLLSRVELSADRDRVTLFYLEQLPPSARVRVTFDPVGLIDQWNRLVDVDGDGQPGGRALIDFDTLATTPLADTAVSGTVYASEPVPGTNATNFINRPLAGVTITVDGAEESLRAVTDANGQFLLQPAPGGDFFVHIDGRTLTNLAEGIRYPDKDYYPFVGKVWHADAGKTNLAAGTGLIYLPLIRTNTLQSVSATQVTMVTFPPSVLASNPALAGVNLMVPANSLFSDNGSRGGKVGIAPVAPDRLPGPLPPGLEFPLVITVQTDGGENFDAPVPACFPNLPDSVTGQPLPPNSKQSLYSFNHDKGVWEAVGPMTVSADGTMICTDAGVGIRQPGWHGAGPTPFQPPPPGPPPTCNGMKEFAECIARFHAEFAANEAKLRDLYRQGEFICNLRANLLGAVHPDTIECWRSFRVDAEARRRHFLEWALARLNQCRNCPNMPPAFGGLGGSGQPCDGKDTFGECIQGCRAERDAALLSFYENAAASQRACSVLQRTYGSEDSGVIACWKTYNGEYLSGLSEILGRYRTCSMSCKSCDDAPLPSSPMAMRKSLPDTGSVPAQIERLHEEIEILIRPYARSDQAVPALVLGQLAQITAWADALAGGDLAAYYQTNIVISEQLLVGEGSAFGRSFGDEPAYPILYAAAVLRSNEVFFLRGYTAAFAQYSLFVPRDGMLLDVTFYDPRTKKYGVVYPNRNPAAEFRLPSVRMVPLTEDEPDFDSDGIPDMIEQVYGTDALNLDSDGDGVKDGAEITQGTNPLDGRPVRTGIIANVKTPGPALDVCAANQLVVVAEGNTGVAIFKAEPGRNAVITAQVDTPGNAQRVACGGNIVAVADGHAGLAIIDITDPPASRVRFQLNLGGPVQCVAVNGTIAYAGLAAGSAGQIVTVDLLNGRVLDRKNVSGPVNDLALGNEYLYALLLNRIITYPLEAGLPRASSTSVDSPYYSTGNIRLFVGADIAYATHPKGYNTFSLTNPALPALIASLNSGQFGWKQIVPNGSGLAVAAVSPNSTLGNPSDHNVSLYDVSNPTQTDVFLTQFVTPGFARAISIYDGLAYVADDTAGLQIINCRAYDALGVPPTITLTTSAPTNGIEEGKLMRVTAPVSDDVQVRNVEFYVDGQRVLTDGNFPFEHRLLSPKWVAGKSNFIMQALATDTGGNTNWSAPLDIPLFHEMTPPALLLAAPYDGGFLAASAPPIFSARFSEPLDPATVNALNVRITSAGADGTNGTSDDAAVAGELLYREELNSITFTASAPLPVGRYRVALSSNLADRATNPLSNPGNFNFRVVTNYLIAYSVAGSPQGTNWLMLSDGSYDEPITEGEWPRLSPNGRYLAFRRGTQPEMVRRDIWVRDLVSGTEGPVFVVGNFPVGNFVWTGDSAHLIFDYDFLGVTRVDYNGANRTRLGLICNGWWPSLNPVDQSFLFVVPPSPGTVVQYADAGLTQCLDIPNTRSGFSEGYSSSSSWSPDGQRVAFLFGRAASPIPSGLATIYEGNIFTIRPDGSERSQLTFFNFPYPNYISPDYFSPSLVWSPTGDSIVTAGHINGEYGIYRVDTTSGIVTKIKGSMLPINYVGSYFIGAPPSQAAD